MRGNLGPMLDAPMMSKDGSKTDRSTNCAICDAQVAGFGEATVLGDRLVRYFRCESCGFVQTEEPDWLARSYSRAITLQDVGLVARNLEFAERTEAVVRLCHDANSRFLDFGGGYGLLTRLLRDRGLDFHHYDPHCENLFAYSAAIHGIDECRWELVTAFELLEHLVDPLPQIRQIMSCTDTLLCSTVLLPDPTPAPGTWHYYGLEHGQHVSLFSIGALEELARACDVRLLTNGRNLHVLTRAKVRPWLHALALGRWGRRLRRHFPRRPSLVEIDARLLQDASR